jgi:hypothetical protein
MAGGGQVRPMGGAIQSALNSGQGIGNFVNSALGANPNPAPMRGNPAPMSSGGVAGVDFPRRGEEGSFYGQQAQAFRPSIAPQGNFNVNQAAAGGLQQAMQGTQAAMNYAPMAVRPTAYNAANASATGYNPSAMTSANYGASTIGQSPTVTAQNVQAGQLANTDLGAYTNPFESQVVDQALGDIERSRLMAQNQLGAQATSANAFGGSRQGIAEAETNRAFADQAARTASGLRQAGYTQAQQMAMQDIGTAQQAALANQNANLAAGTTTAGFGQQSNLANQAALNQAGQFGATAANQAAAANMGAQNQAAQFGSGASNQMALSNMAALNQANQYGATNAMSAQIANQNALANANQAKLQAANQMGALGQQAFGTGQAIQNQQLQQGILQQGMQQALIDAAKAQYAGYTGSPMQALSAPLAALGSTPNQSTTTNGMKPGLFNYLQLGANVIGGMK